jgi:hypothetical protein
MEIDDNDDSALFNGIMTQLQMDCDDGNDVVWASSAGGPSANNGSGPGCSPLRRKTSRRKAMHTIGAGVGAPRTEASGDGTVVIKDSQDRRKVSRGLFTSRLPKQR